MSDLPWPTVIRNTDDPEAALTISLLAADVVCPSDTYALIPVGAIKERVWWCGMDEELRPASRKHECWRIGHVQTALAGCRWVRIVEEPIPTESLNQESRRESEGEG